MALFSLQVRFQYGDRFWTNKWELSAADIGTVIGLVSDFEAFHTAILLTNYVLKDMRISPIPSTGAFETIVLNSNGAKGDSGQQILSLFNTVALDLVGTFFGRHGLKYLRGTLTNADLENDGTIKDSTATAILSDFTTLLGAVSSAGAAIVTGGGHIVSSADIPPAVQMRQLHRKRRKTA